MKKNWINLLMIAAFVLMAVSTAVNAKPGSNATAEVNFLKSVPKNATLAQIKKLLPKGTKFGSPKWEAGGNSISFRGKISGEAQFLNARQEKFQSSVSYREDSDEISKKHPAAIKNFNATDPINQVTVLMDSGKNSSWTDAKQRIAAVQKILGKPQAYHYMKDAGSMPMDGWYADWGLSAGRHIYCYNNYVNYKARTTATMLYLQFDTYFYPFG